MTTSGTKGKSIDLERCGSLCEMHKVKSGVGILVDTGLTQRSFGKSHKVSVSAGEL